MKNQQRPRLGRSPAELEPASQWPMLVSTDPFSGRSSAGLQCHQHTRVSWSALIPTTLPSWWNRLRTLVMQPVLCTTAPKRHTPTSNPTGRGAGHTGEGGQWGRERHLPPVRPFHSSRAPSSCPSPVTVPVPCASMCDAADGSSPASAQFCGHARTHTPMSHTSPASCTSACVTMSAPAAPQPSAHLLYQAPHENTLPAPHSRQPFLALAHDACSIAAWMAAATVPCDLRQWP